MQQYLFRRVGLAFLALIALSILTFLLVRSEGYEGHHYYWDAAGTIMKSHLWSSSTPAIRKTYSKATGIRPGAWNVGPTI